MLTDIAFYNSGFFDIRHCRAGSVTRPYRERRFTKWRKHGLSAVLLHSELANQGVGQGLQGGPAGVSDRGRGTCEHIVGSHQAQDQIALLGDQLVVVAPLDDVALVQDHDAVGIHNRA